MVVTGDEAVHVPIPAGLVPEGVTIEEGAVVAFHDHIGNEQVWVEITTIFESAAMGPSVRGIEYLTPKCPKHGGLCDHNYVAHRAIPLSMLVDPNQEIAKEEARKEAKRAGRVRRSGGPGMCEHCGEPTGGGKFQPGHDAKLKSDLQHDVRSKDKEHAARACAEAQMRAAAQLPDDPRRSKWWIEPPASMRAEVAKYVKQGDGFMRSRIAQRTGQDPGRMEEIA